jgi:hypothetical protein
MFKMLEGGQIVEPTTLFTAVLWWAIAAYGSHAELVSGAVRLAAVSGRA